MLTLPSSVRVFVARDPIDLHWSFDRLAGAVRHQLASDPLSGHLFVFFNRSRTATKILFYERGGYALYYRRLERGTFQRLSGPPEAPRLEVDGAILAMILEGIALDAPRRPRFVLDREKSASCQS